MIPFGQFGIDPKTGASEVLADISKKVRADHCGHVLIQGDFNLKVEPLEYFLPDLFTDGLQEVPFSMPTTPKRKWLDRILFKGMGLKTSRVVDGLLTDHFPVAADFEIKQ